MSRTLDEDVPTMSAGSGQIAGIGVGPQGEPGVDIKARRKKRPTTDSPSVSDIVQAAAKATDITTEEVRHWFDVNTSLEEGKRQDFPVPGARIPFTIERTKDVLANNLIYRVYRKDMPDQKVGYAKLSGDRKSVMDVNIAPIFQRQGIASALYDFIERDQRITLRPSPMWQSAAGKAFWVARRNRPVTEDLRNWFGSGKTGGIGGGGWDRYNTKGERIGKCGDAEDRGGKSEGKPKCLSRQKAAQLRAQGGKNAIANAVKRKKAQDPVTDRKGTGNAPRPVSNRIGEAAFHLPTKSLLQNIDRLDTGLADMLVKRLFGDNYFADEINGRKRITKRMSSWASPIKVAIGNTWKDAVAQVPGQKRPLFAEREASMKPLHEKNVPTNPDLWSRAKAEAKKRFDVYPSAYANGWAAKWYKEKGGGWKSQSNEASSPAQQAAIAIAMKKAGKTPKNEASTPTDREQGTNSLTAIYKQNTPGQIDAMLKELATLSEAWQQLTTESCDCCGESEVITESEYQGRKVTLGKPMRTPDGPKKFSVYVRNDKGNIVKVNFGDPNMEIKRDDPDRRSNFRARHNCDNPGPRWKARYWSCKFWSKKSVSDLT